MSKFQTNVWPNVLPQHVFFLLINDLHLLHRAIFNDNGYEPTYCFKSSSCLSVYLTGFYVLFRIFFWFQFSTYEYLWIFGLIILLPRIFRSIYVYIKEFLFNLKKPKIRRPGIIFLVFLLLLCFHINYTFIWRINCKKRKNVIFILFKFILTQCDNQKPVWWYTWVCRLS